MFRVLKMARHMSHANVLLNAMRASYPKIAVFLFSIMTLVSIEGTLMYLVEGSINPDFSSIPQSIYWGIVTITTVGYGDVAPITVAGKMLASVIMLTGFSIIAVPTGIVTAELGRSMKKVDMDSRECDQCGWEGHDRAANYCKHCGDKLSV
jgi:voltage-gated potassium channel